MTIAHSELCLNKDGSIYHLSLFPEQLADTVIVVGDPARVKKISCHFDRIEHVASNREFLTHTGYIGHQRLSVISIGMGTGCVDIAMNELDALKNIDFTTRKPKDTLTQLNIIRIGTSGCIQPDIHAGDFIVSDITIGFDVVTDFYQQTPSEAEKRLRAAVQHHFADVLPFTPYAFTGNSELIKLFRAESFKHGMTVTACGFFGAQSRLLRLPLAIPQLHHRVETFHYQHQRVLNYEMESAAIYGLGQLLGHRCIAVCLAIANRVTGEFLREYDDRMQELIKQTLELICNSSYVESVS